MRRTILTFAVAALMVGPALADIGTVTMDLKVSVDGVNYFDDICGLPACPTSVQVEIYGSATTGGTTGVNNGVQAIYTDIIGDCLVGVMQQATVLDATFTMMYFPLYGLNGLGFDVLPDTGTATVGGIYGIGAAQAAPPGPTAQDMPGAMTAAAPHANGTPPVLIATGTVFLNCIPGPCPVPGCTDPFGCTITTAATGANLWDMAGNAVPALIVEDAAGICWVPEPATLMLLVPTLLLLRRRR